MGTRVEQLLQADQWDLAEATGSIGTATLRYRVPVLLAGEAADYDRCLRIVWIYAEEGSGALPDQEALVALEDFENRLCDALESDALGVLTAVLTLDGARQWVFYTADLKACSARLNDMPQREEPYPIELDSFPDQDWSYLREDILAIVRAA